MLERTLRRPPDKDDPPTGRAGLDRDAIAAALDAIEQRTAAAAVLIAEPVVWRAYCLGYTNAQAPASEVIADLRRRNEAAEDVADELYEALHNPGRQLTELRARRIAEALDEAYRAGDLRTLEDEVRVAVDAARAPARPGAVPPERAA